MSARNRHWAAICRVLVLVVSVSELRSQQTGITSPDDSLEALLNTEVTTASRIPEKRSRVPAAVYVITSEDIRRAGARSIPEALRLVPGIQVARIDASKWAVGVRGFASRLARSMLVLMDGRAVYSPLFAGTYWEVQDTLLEDVDRIEVILGPGGTLWGANAVNGVINIITKEAGATEGGLVSVGGGTELQSFARFRYGARSGPGAYRIYGKYSGSDAAYHSDGSNFDDWRMTQGGFRSDWTLRRDRALTLQGDIYKGAVGQRSVLTTYTAPYRQMLDANARLSGGNVLARWSSPAVGAQSELRLQAYYDRTNRREATFREARDTADIDLQHHLYSRWRQELVWGFGYRVTSGDFTGLPTLRFTPGRRTDHIVSGFLQDDIELVPERLHLIAGSKWEHNGYSGFENQPSGRLLWTPNSRHTLLLSVARAVRIPSRVEHDLELTSLLQMLNPSVAAFLRLGPNPDFHSEKLIAYEAAYRVRPAARLYVTLSAFYNHYKDLVSNEVRTPFLEAEPAPPHVVLPLIWGNGLGGHAHGGELTADWRPTGALRLNGSYSYLRINLHKKASSLDNSTERSMEGASPRHQVKFQSSISAGPAVEFDWMFRYVAALPSQRIARYATSNARVAWRATRRLELEAVGQNLHQPRHAESSGGVEIERGVYGKMTWKW